MRLFSIHAGMPLLVKELLEQAARRRTYIIRMTYALMLFAVFAYHYFSLSRYGNSLSILGTGGRLLETLVYTQFFGIFLFLPAMMSGVIAAEKEKESLALLFLTDMSPWELLLQKFMGRLIPMLTFLLLSLPMMAVAYALGGVDSSLLFLGVVLLLLTCLQAGALALLCSTLCRSTAGAFISSYIGLAGFYGLPVLTLGLLRALGARTNWNENLLFACFPIYAYAEYPRAMLAFSVPAELWLCLAAIAASALVFLLAARFFLVRRAFAPARNPLLGLFRRLDTTFTRWNARFGNIVVGRGKGELPDDEPVAWREQQRRAMGRSHHLLRIGLAIEIPVLLLSLAIWSDGGSFHRARNEGHSAMVIIVWVLATLTTTVQGANAIAAEASHQTLDVLLATPLSAADIVRQKMRALRGIYVVFAVPLLTLMMTSLWVSTSLSWHDYYRGDDGILYYVCGTLLSMFIFLPLTAWMGLWIGIRVRPRYRALITSVAVVVAWCVLPILGAVFIHEVTGWDEPLKMTMLLSPALPVGLTEFGAWKDLFRDAHAILFPLTFACYAAGLFFLRRHCLANAEYWLRRE